MSRTATDASPSRDSHDAPPPGASLAGDASLSAAAGWEFLATGFVARIPASTIQLFLLLYVSSVGLGMGLAGLTVAAVGLGSAVGAPVLGRLVDRWGPLPVVAGATVVQVLGLLVARHVVIHDGTAAALMGTAALVGAANPQIGSIARARWSSLARELGRPGLVTRGLGHETAADEIGFILGPVIAGALVGWLDESTAILALVGWVVVGQGLFIAHLARHRGGWRTSSDEGGAQVEGIPFGRLVAPMATVLGVGTVFGAGQTSLSALNAATGSEAWTGFVWGAMGVGSALASLAAARVFVRWSLAARILLGALVAAIGLGMMTAGQPLAVQFVVFPVTGLGLGLMLVSAYAAAEVLAPAGRINAVMTLMAMCLVLGVSLGSATAGQVAGAGGFWIGVAACGVGAVAGVVLAKRAGSAPGADRGDL